MKLDDSFHGISTLITTYYGPIQNKGSGFFYSEFGERDEKNPQWIQVKDTWLVSNRHVFLPKIKEKETIPEKFIFNLWKIKKDSIDWLPIEIDRNEFLKRAKFHADPKIDVAIIRIQDLVTDIVKKEPKDPESHHTSIMNYFVVSKEKLPGNNKINVQVSDDILIVGYPRGYYDEHNKFPIVKSGIIASRWGANFEGKPCFLIDAKLFPGSSGSIVLSKPVDIVVENGKLLTSNEKQFAFLGIFSGEPYLEHDEIETDELFIKVKSGFNVGIVWYGHLIEEIINNGVWGEKIN